MADKTSTLKRTVLLSVLICIAAFVAAVKVISAKLTTSYSNESVRILPVAVSGPESVLFDRDTATAFAPEKQSETVISFGAGAALGSVRVYGSSAYHLTIFKMNKSGGWSEIPGLSNIRLSDAGSGWNSFEASLVSSADKYMLRLQPYVVSGAKNPGVAEIEFWAQGSRTNISGAEHAVSAADTANSALFFCKKYTASPEESEVRIVREYGKTQVEDAVFVISGQFAVTTDIRRAWLVYELQGYGSWIGAEHTINGAGRRTAWPMAASSGWTKQQEAINPSLLKTGDNTVTFSLPYGAAAGYKIKNVMLVTETDNGFNHISAVSGSGEVQNMTDGNEFTSWKPADGYSQAHLDFYRQAQAGSVRLLLNGTISGTISFTTYLNGVKKTETNPIDASTLTAGWNVIPLGADEDADSAALNVTVSAGSTGSFSEIAVCGSVTGSKRKKEIIITYPDNGQYYGRAAYVAGFLPVTDNGSGQAVVLAGPNPMAVDNGVFSGVVSKEDAGFENDDDSAGWSADITLIYPDGEKIVRTLRFTQNRALLADNPAEAENEAYGFGVKPNSKRKMKLKDIELEIDSQDEEKSSNIQVLELGDKDIPPLDIGMVNVTGKGRKGYRFLPHGSKFKKKMRMRLPYDRKKLPPGKNDDDIRAYYYNDRVNRWLPVEREKIDKDTSETVNLTDHFTDFINAVIVVPDHPQLQNFNPNTIKDLKAALPGSGITMLNPPSANNKGDASLNYPIEIPPGRNGMQPNVSIVYNSSGGDGLAGYGWDLPVRSISCDTKWGVPRYDPNFETESYLFEGEQLIPTARGNVYEPRTASDKRFFERTEGRFLRIVRKVTDTTAAGADKYYWEVTDKNGTVHVYGEKPSDPGSNSMIGPAGRGTFMWALRSSTDRNGNQTKYYYRTDERTSNNNLLLDYITYTGKEGVDDGYYLVRFNYENKLNASAGGSGIKSDGRGGFIRRYTKKLSSVEVLAGGQQVRKYEFKYVVGNFKREYLDNILQYGGASSPVIDPDGHKFEYYSDIDSYGGIFSGNFDTQWNTYTSQNDTEQIKLLGLINLPNGPSAISANITRSWGENKNISGGLWPWFKIHVNWGYSNSTGHSVYSLMDLDGDSIPDQIFTRSGNDFSYMWRPNLWSLIAQDSGFADYILPGDGLFISGLRAISLDRSKAEMRSGGIGIGSGLGVSGNKAEVASTQSRYMMDVNGDGLPDLVDAGTVMFASRTFDSSGKPVITYNCDSSLTEVEVGQSADLDPEMIAELLRLAGEKYKEEVLASPLVSVIKKWDVPFTGFVKIEGDVKSVTYSAYAERDGIWASIQHKGSVLWKKQIDDDGADAHTPTGVGSIEVTAGDVLYFRLQSYYDGMFDRVQWAPEISYTSFGPARDVNNLDLVTHKYTDDFTLAGRRDISTKLNYKGKIRIAGDVIKKGVTSDDIRLRIILKHPIPTPTATPVGTPYIVEYIETDITDDATGAANTLGWHQIGSLPMGNSGPEPGGTTYYREVTFAAAGDEIILRLETDSNIDLGMIEWHPLIYYTDILQTAGEPVPPAIDTHVSEPRDEFSKYIEKIYSPYDIMFYPRRLDYKMTSPHTVVKPLLDPYPMPAGEAEENVVLRLRGMMSKSAATSQDITVVLVINSQTNADGTLIEGTGTTVNVCVIPKEVTGSCFTLPDNFVILKPNSTASRSLLPLNNIRIRLMTGTKADMETITWDPKLRYSSMQYSTVGTEWVYKDFGPVVESPIPYEADLMAENETWIRNMSIKPGLVETAGNTVPVRVALTVKRPVELIGKGIFDVAAGPAVEQLIALRDIRVGEDIYFEAFTSTSTSYQHISITEPIYVPGVYSNFFFGDAVNPIVNRYSDVEAEFFASPYRGWAVGGLKETPEILRPDYVPDDSNETLEKVLMISDDGYLEYFRMPSKITIRRDTYAFDETKLSLSHLGTMAEGLTYTAVVSDMDQFIFLPSPYDPDNAGNTVNMWKATDSIFCTSTDMSSSRVAQKNIRKLSLSDIIGDLTGGCNTRGIVRHSTSWQGGLSVSAFGIGGFGSLGQSTCISDFFDMNGDGFPDFVSGGNGVQYTRAEGGLSSLKSGSVVISNSLLVNVGVGSPNDPAITIPDGQGEAGSDGTEAAGSESKGLSMSGGFSFSGSTSMGVASIIHKLMDMNGDGLPDLVKLPAYTNIQQFFDSGSYKKVIVQLNMGYGNFGPEEDWALDHPTINSAICNNMTISGGAGIGIGGSIGGGDTGISEISVVSVGASGGISGGLSFSRTLQSLMDVNGDGLPDFVARDGSVRFNTGNGFTGFYDYGLGGNYGNSHSVSVGDSYGFNINISIPVPPFGIIQIGGSYSKNKGESLSKQTSMVMDVNGDGYPDRIVSNGADSGRLDIEYNKTGRTGLLKKVIRPMGSEMHFDYSRSVNSYDQPRSKWNLTSVTLTAVSEAAREIPGITDSLPDQNVFYSYSGGKYEKYDREFLGYAGVSESVRLNQGSMRVVEKEYCNDNRHGDDTAGIYTGYSYRGILLREAVYEDGLTTPHYEKIYTYESEPTPVATSTVIYSIARHPDSRSYFPKLESVTEKFYEANDTAPVIRTEEYEYDKCGNITKYSETDSEGQKVVAVVDYNIGTTAFADSSGSILGYKAINLPLNISVTDGSGALLRKREAEYNGLDNIIKVVQYSSATHSITTALSYDPVHTGNLKTLILPQNSSGFVQSFTYDYDTTVNQYITSIMDNNGYGSRTEYDFKYGAVKKVTDENGNTMDYTYDKYGRLIEVYGPNEAGGGIAAYYEYRPAGLGTEKIPYAVTKNRDMHLGDADPIKIITYTDGFGRVIQTKKDASVTEDGVNLINAMVVSGKVQYDNGGRMVRQYYPVYEAKTADLQAGSEGLSGDPGNTAFNIQTGAYSTLYQYDAYDRNVLITYPDGNETQFAYRKELDKLVTRITDANGNYKETFKDSEQLIREVRESDNQTNPGSPHTIASTYDYNPLGEMIQVIQDSTGQRLTTLVGYDLLGRRTSIQNPDTGLVTTEYDDVSNISAKQTGNLMNISASTKITYTYNQANQLINVNYPAMAPVPAETVTYTYGGPGAADNGAARIVSVNFPGGSKEFKYDALGSVVYEKNTVNLYSGNIQKETHYTWDNLGRMLNMTYPDGEVLTYGYDNGGLLTSAVGDRAGTQRPYLKHIYYDVFGKRVDILTGSGSTSDSDQSGTGTRYEYIANNQRLGRLVSAPRDASGTMQPAIQDLTFVYDPVGNIKDLNNSMPYNMEGGTDQFVNRHFDYDGFYRLTNSTGQFQKNAVEGNYMTYSVATTYNDVHNMITKNQSVAGGTAGEALNYNFTYTYNAAQPHAPGIITNNLISPAVVRTNTYDHNGNLTHYAEDGTITRNLTWDTENRLRISVDNVPALTETYRYDDSGQRVYKRTQYGSADNENAYVNQYANYVLDTGDTTGMTENKHVFAGNQRIASILNIGGTLTEYYYQTDHLGSTGYLTDKDGALKQHIEYTPWGESWFDNSDLSDKFISYKFTGKEQDSTGLYYFGARYYDPRTSVWVSTDPMVNAYIPTSKVLMNSKKVLFGMKMMVSRNGLRDNLTLLMKSNTSYEKNNEQENSESVLLNDGVYVSGNLNYYSYVNCNPIVLIDIDGLYWEYAQSTGKLTYVSDATGKRYEIGTGYSGKGEGLNNPLRAFRKNEGPIPQGDWKISEAFKHKSKGSVVMKLSSAASEQAYGRSEFLIHGDNDAMNKTASEGCIILDKSIRDRIAKSKDKNLKVVR